MVNFSFVIFFALVPSYNKVLNNGFLSPLDTVAGPGEGQFYRNHCTWCLPISSSALFSVASQQLQNLKACFAKMLAAAFSTFPNHPSRQSLILPSIDTTCRQLIQKKIFFFCPSVFIWIFGISISKLMNLENQNQQSQFQILFIH